MKDFCDKVAIITGSSRGIGKAVAAKLAKQGAKVVLNGRDQKKLNTTTQELREGGYTVISLQGDISNEHDCRRLIETTIERFGRIDILINNAGVSMRGEVQELSPALINIVFQINTIGPFMLSQMALPHLKKTKGSIVFVSSLAGLRGLPYLSAYSASKMALTALAESLRVEHIKDGIHIGLVYAGYTEIEKGKTTLNSEGQSVRLEERTGNLKHTIDEVAEKIVYHIAKRKKQTVIGVTGYLYSFLVKLFPGLTERIVSYQHKKMTKIYK
jgi:short-subunit dehydrogenase